MRSIITILALILFAFPALAADGWYAGWGSAEIIVHQGLEPNSSYSTTVPAVTGGCARWGEEYEIRAAANCTVTNGQVHRSWPQDLLIKSVTLIPDLSWGGTQGCSLQLGYDAGSTTLGSAMTFPITDATPSNPTVMTYDGLNLLVPAGEGLVLFIGAGTTGSRTNCTGSGSDSGRSTLIIEAYRRGAN